jgi:hypothetical protein
MVRSFGSIGISGSGMGIDLPIPLTEKWRGMQRRHFSVLYRRLPHRKTITLLERSSSGALVDGTYPRSQI